MINVWPWSKIDELENQIKDLQQELRFCQFVRDYWKGSSQRLQVQNKMMKLQLEPYRKSITDSHGRQLWRTLNQAEHDILDQKFYISVLETEVSKESVENAKKKYNALKNLKYCKEEML